MNNILGKQGSHYTGVFVLSIIASTLLFLFYQGYLLPLKISLMFYLSMAIIAISFACISIINDESNATGTSLLLFTLILTYTFLKMGYLLVVPPETLSIYPDAYNIYQIVESLSIYSHLLNPSFYTLGAQSISTTPLLPIFLHILSMISCLNAQYVVKYYPLIYAPLMIVAYFLILKKLRIIETNKITMGITIGVFNPWTLGFLTWGHYSNSSILFLLLLFWVILSLTSDGGNQGRLFIIFIIFTFAMFFTHTYMGIVYIAIFTTYLIYIHIIRRSLNKPWLYLVAAYSTIFVHIIYYATIYAHTLVSYVQYVAEALEFGNPFQAIQYYGTPQASNLPLAIIKYTGLSSLAILSMTSTIWYYLKHKKDTTKYSLFASMMVTGIVLNIPYYFLPLYGTDLFNRLTFFVAIGASPFIVTYISVHIDKPAKKKLTFRHVVFAIFLFFILMFNLLQAIRPDIVDWTTPIVSGEDIRLPRTEWYFLSRYISSNIAQDSEMLGLRIGVPFIGLLARMNYKQLSISPSTPKPLIPPENFKEITLLKGELFFLRRSMVEFPDPGYVVKNEDLMYVIKESNIIYMASDALVIMP